jgi:hypothetical protein
MWKGNRGLTRVCQVYATTVLLAGVLDVVGGGGGSS